MVNEETMISEEGTVEFIHNLAVENKDVSLNNSEVSNPSIPFVIDFNAEEVTPVDISDLESFTSIKVNVLKSHYVSLFRRSDILHLITDNKLYYRINTANVNADEIAKLLLFRKPKKIVFDIDEFKDLITEYTIGFWDLKLIFRILWGIDVTNAKDIYKLLNISINARKSTFLYCYNFINIARELNIYVEKMKMNKGLLLELDILKEAKLCENRGMLIDKSKYEEYKETIINKYKILEENKEAKYGKDVNFSDINSLLVYLNNNNQIPSLERSILESKNNQLFCDLKIYNDYKNIANHMVVNNKFVINYNTYSDYEIKVNIVPEYCYLDNDNQIMIEGGYSELYYRVLCELIKDKNLIKGISRYSFIRYMNEYVLENKNLGIYTEIFIKAFAKEYFEPTEIQLFSQAEYNTVISEDDINYILNLFKEKTPRLINFFSTFDGEDVIYERYNKKIFNPSVNVDLYVKQIKNLIFKTAISYVKAAILEYNAKYKNDDEIKLSIVAFFDDKILLSTTQRSLSVGIDILNRYMAVAYKEFIINTKYYNNTRTLTTKD